MSFKEVLNRLIKGWWLILIFTLIFTAIFYRSGQPKDTFRASISIGITFDNNFQEQNVKDTLENTPSLFTSTSGQIGQYLLFRFSSVEVQDMVAKKMGISVSNLNNTVPFYRVLNQFAGFVSISYDSESKEAVEKFLKAIKEVYIYLIDAELNNNQTNTYKVRPQENLIQSVTTISEPTQQRVLPSVVGLLVGIVASVLLPTILSMVNKKVKN
jgi:capsular polysaccharide biosynthesis protein